jgi:hypothetical protein
MKIISSNLQLPELCPNENASVKVINRFPRCTSTLVMKTEWSKTTEGAIHLGVAIAKIPAVSVDFGIKSVN